MGKEKPQIWPAHRSDYSRVEQNLPEYSQFKPESNVVFVQPRKKDTKKEQRKERKTEENKEAKKQIKSRCLQHMKQKDPYLGRPGGSWL